MSYTYLLLYLYINSKELFVFIICYIWFKHIFEQYDVRLFMGVIKLKIHR